MSDEEIGKIRLFEFDKGVEFASNVLNKEIAERDATIKQLQEENRVLKKDWSEAITELKSMDEWVKELRQENQRLKEVLNKLLTAKTFEERKHSWDDARKLIEP